jgi:hypothetical protein
MSIKYNDNPLFILTSNKNCKYNDNIINLNIPVQNLCKIIDLELSIDIDKYIELLWRRDNCPIDREDIYMMRATNSIISVSYNESFDIIGTIKNDLFNYYISKNINKSITKIKFHHDIKKIDYIKFMYGTYSIKLTYNDIIIFQKILDFNKDEFPFFPFRDGLPMNKEIMNFQIKYIDIITPFSNESPTITIYTNDNPILINTYYLHYYIKELYDTNNWFDLSILNSDGYIGIINYIVAETNEIDIIVDIDEFNQPIKIRYCYEIDKYKIFKICKNYCDFSTGIKISSDNPSLLKIKSEKTYAIIIKHVKLC